MFSSYQQVEGGAASDGNGFDRPPGFRGVPTRPAGRAVCGLLPGTLLLPGGDGPLGGEVLALAP